MLVASFVSMHPTMGDTRTYEDFYKFLGDRPARLGVMARLYPELTSSYLLDGLRNVFYRDSKSTDRFRSIDSMRFEWEVETNYIKRIYFAEKPTVGDTWNSSEEIEMSFTERYYEKYDIFKVDKTEQQFQVIAHPIRKADNYWTVICRLVDSDFSTSFDSSGCQIGDTTRWIGNAISTKLGLFLIVALLRN